MIYTSLFETPAGTGLVQGSHAGITAVFLPGDDRWRAPGGNSAAPAVSSPLTEQVAKMFQQHFNGVAQPFENILVDVYVGGEFRQRVLHLIRSIGWGEVRSYGEVALLAGAPGAARAVGGAMAANPVPVVIPCHRVVSCNGRLTGFSAPGGIALKKYLLQLEGVQVAGERVRFFTGRRQ